MSEQPGFDPNSEQAKDGERKGAEKDFSTQLQERMQLLAEKNFDTAAQVTFEVKLDGDADGVTFGVTAANMPGIRNQYVSFEYGGASHSLCLGKNGYVDFAEIKALELEAHLIDWGRIVSNEHAPKIVRMIAERMNGLVHKPESVEPIAPQTFQEFVGAAWDEADKKGVPVEYSSVRTYQTDKGVMHIAEYGDFAKDGVYLPEKEKRRLNLDVHCEDFRYVRETFGGETIEQFLPKINVDSLDPLTEEQREHCPYEVSFLDQTKSPEGEDGRMVDNNGNQVELLYSEAFIVIKDGNIQDRFPTLKEAQDAAYKLYARDLALEGLDPYDITLEHQKQVLDALDAALLAAELPVQVNQDMEGEL